MQSQHAGNDVRAEYLSLIRASGIHVSEAELDTLLIIDYGLNDVRKEGVAVIDIVYTDAQRHKILAMLPNQTLPEHTHPPYDDFAGKEEVLRVISGSIRVYLPGADTMREGFLPAGKEAYYSCRNEQVLGPLGQVAIPPNTIHWFQAGPDGLVAYAFYTQAVESNNIFSDPGVPKEISPGY
jgi:D-lyxose ketol-isomerase